MGRKSREDIEKEELEKKETEDNQRKESERQEQVRKEREEFQTKLAEQERKTNEANEKFAKLEGSLEAMRNFQAQQANRPPEWTQEQWEAFEEKTGLKKETLSTIDSVFGQKLKEVEGKFEARTKQAEDRAKQAEERFDNSEKVRSYETNKKEYFAKKPHFARYEKDFDEFVSEFPIETRKDPEKLAKLFDKAGIYVRGKVGEKEMRRDNGGSTRFGSDNGGSGDEEPEKPDLSDLRAHERLTIEKILTTKEREKMLKENRHDLKGDNGIMINTRDEFNRYKK